MKKVLIISYFFPPCNLTAAQRIKGWADYLSENGYYPVVITRNWDHPVQQPEDVLKSSGTEMIHKKNERYEAYYLPYTSSRRDRIYTKYKGSPLQKISRAFTFVNLVTENFTVRSIPHANMYDFARKLIKEDDTIEKMIISGNPFNQFYFGYLLNKETGIKWIADYRDDWNTSEVEQKKTGLNALIGKLQHRSEKKWVQSAEMITSVSPYYTEKISNFTGRPGAVILNGFEVREGEKSNVSNEKFLITYNGSLYTSQTIEPFLEMIGKLIHEGYTEIQLKFPGLAFNPIQKKRVAELTRSYKDHVEITNRIPKEDVLDIQRRSDLLLMISHTGIKGVPSSKLYEYIGLEKEVLLYPNDHDIIEETLNDTGLGLICDRKQNIYEVLKLRLEEKRSGNTVKNKGNKERIQFYSRQQQAKALSTLLDKL